VGREDACRTTISAKKGKLRLGFEALLVGLNLWRGVLVWRMDEPVGVGADLGR
jgi:hypothetical protein